MIIIIKRGRQRSYGGLCSLATALLRHITTQNVASRQNILLCHVASRHVAKYRVSKSYITPHKKYLVTKCLVQWHHITSHHVMSHDRHDDKFLSVSHLVFTHDIPTVRCQMWSLDVLGRCCKASKASVRALSIFRLLLPLFFLQDVRAHLFPPSGEGPSGDAVRPRHADQRREDRRDGDRPGESLPVQIWSHVWPAAVLLCVSRLNCLMNPRYLFFVYCSVIPKIH